MLSSMRVYVYAYIHVLILYILLIRNMQISPKIALAN